MGSIIKHGDAWRAHVYRGRQRRSKVFRTRREAEAWAEKQEDELGTGKGRGITFGYAAERWLAWKLPRLTNADNQRTVEQSIRDHVLPLLGQYRLSDIKRRQLVDVVRRVAERGNVETAHRVGQRIRAIFDHAVDHGDIETHPAAGLSRVLPATRTRHLHAVTPAEVPELLRAIMGYPEPVTRAGLLLLAHTFTRTAELIQAQWTEILEDIWVIPGPRMKMKLPHVVPLSSQSRAILEELRAMTDDSPYILASARNPECGLSNNTLLFALYRLGYKGRMTGHGFRSVASTILNESGLWSSDAVERQLAHKETDRVREAYHRAQYLDERRKMMEWWSSHLNSLVCPG